MTGTSSVETISEFFCTDGDERVLAGFVRDVDRGGAGRFSRERTNSRRSYSRIQLRERSSLSKYAGTGSNAWTCPCTPTNPAATADKYPMFAPTSRNTSPGFKCRFMAAITSRA